MFSKWKKKTNESKIIEIFSPVTGESLSLTQVPDEAFAGGHMGRGVAIEPTIGKLIAPFNGTVAHIIKSNHAIMLEHPSGLQFLFHIGVNTVSLKGEGFISHVTIGDKVEAGQVLIEFDIERIKSEGYPVITPIIVTNADDVTTNLELFSGPVQAGSTVILKAVLKS
ncbi:PTS sugar transporter subunit IIA [Paenibacillus sp. IHBB 10380]|uniref:PTS sugar transporter subunit IIA n=1 Tax=Paenibacillus sp. IHBB 10380 TaxID=1566358 RepID=UPI0005CFB53F|nr:PTS glucose transporter subunit IIA [Paenibacillus sp. IHBB 10380]AJS57246.1 PTS glucose transporter subunit IIA [Paenibacillus sp. IHBB 10380]